MSATSFYLVIMNEMVCRLESRGITNFIVEYYQGAKK